MARRKLEPLPLYQAERIAHILGESSAMAMAIGEMKRRQAAGENVMLFTSGNSVVVGPSPDVSQ
jgi:hypothetical protein